MGLDPAVLVFWLSSILRLFFVFSEIETEYFLFLTNVHSGAWSSSRGSYEETICPDSDFLHKSIIVGDFLTNFVQKWQNQSEIKFIFGKPPKTLSLEI